MTKGEKAAALQPGSRMWEELMEYRDLLQVGLEDSVQMFCRNQVFGEEYQDLRPEILYALQKVVDEYTLRPFDRMIEWVRDLSQHIGDNPNGSRFNRFSPYPCFVNQDCAGSMVVAEYTYAQGVPPPASRLGLGEIYWCFL
jgi:hypothetical protein